MKACARTITFALVLVVKFAAIAANAATLTPVGSRLSADGASCVRSPRVA
jgi:hypothetical protein